MSRFLSLITLLCLVAPSLASAATNSYQMLLTARVTPVAMSSAPRGAQRIPMLDIEFTNDRSDVVSAHSVLLHHGGLGKTSEISSVYAMFGGVRVSKATSRFSSDGSIRVYFTPSIKLTKGQSRKVTIAIDLASTATAGSEHKFSVLSYEDIDAGGTRVDLLRETNSISRIRTAPPIRGSISVEYLRLPRIVKYGANQTIARLKLSADRVDDHWLREITLTNDGKARGDDLQSLRLESSRGVPLAPVRKSLDGDKVTFGFDTQVMLRRNADIILVVKADVMASRSQTIRLILEEPSDLRADPATRR